MCLAPESVNLSDRSAAWLLTISTKMTSPSRTNLIPLALLVLGDSATNELVKAHPSITLDGCPKQCAKKIVGECGGQVVQDIVIMDVYRNNNHLKPEGIAELNESGQLLARVAADMAKCTIDASSDCSKEEPHA